MTLRRFGRFRHGAGAVWAAFEAERWHALDGAPWHNPACGAVLPEGLSALAPVAPTKIVCVGQNYRKHAAEMGKPVPEQPLLFLKALSALNGPGADVWLPPESQEVHYESELGVVVGERLTRATPEACARAVFGLVCFNDVTARDIQRREVQHTRAKSFDTFACVGPTLVSGLDWAALPVRGSLNGVRVQDGDTSDLVFPIPALLSFISHAMTLEPGDLIATGTPAGVGAVRDGDVFAVEIPGIGILENRFRALSVT